VLGRAGDVRTGKEGRENYYQQDREGPLTLLPGSVINNTRLGVTARTIAIAIEALIERAERVVPEIIVLLRSGKATGFDGRVIAAVSILIVQKICECWTGEQGDSAKQNERQCWLFERSHTCSHGT